MAAIRLMRKWSIPLATAVAAPIFTPVVFADSDKKNAETNTSRMVRPSDMPIYETPQEVLNYEYHGKERTSLEENIGVVRKEVEGVISATRSTREKIVHICETGKAHTMATMDMLKDLQPSPATIDYITDEENVLPRAGAITVGGLTGLVIGRKGGFLKKVLYTSTGALTAASLCYPRHAYQASQKVLENAKDIGTIGYNFVAGVKPQNKVPSPPTEDKKEEPAPEAVAEAAPVPTPAPELEGGEVRKVIPENVTVEDFLSPLDSVVQQSSDVTVWGFRLTDKPSEDLSPKSNDAPSKSVVPEGFGTVADEIQHDTDKITEEVQESQTASLSGQTPKCQVVTGESVVKEDIEMEETPFESKEPEPLTLVKEEKEDVGSESELVATMTDIPVQTEPKLESASLEHESLVIEHEAKEQDKTEGVTETKIISHAAEHTEAKEETSIPKEALEKSEMTSVTDKAERQETHILKDNSLSSEEDNVQKVGLVNEIINFFSNNKNTEPIEKNELQVKEIVIEGGEKVEEKIAEAVIEVAEAVEKEMIEVIKETEVVEDVSKKVESVLEIVEDVASAAAKAAHDTPEIPESVAEKAELTKIVAEKAEEIVDTVEFVVEEVEGTAVEIKEKAEDIENKMVELIESKEKREELIEKAYDFVADKVSELSNAEIKEPTERSFEIKEIDINDTKINKLEEVPSNEDNNKSELMSPKDEITESQEIMGKETLPSAEIESTESSEKLGIVNKVIQFFKSDKEKSVKDSVEPLIVNKREGVEDPITGAVIDEVKLGSDEVGQPTQVVEDESKASESIANVVEHGANEVTKITEVIEGVCEKAELGIDVAEDIASAAAAAAHDIPGIPKFVEENAEEAKDIAEEAKEVVSTVEFIAEKVESFTEHIKEEAEIFKDKSKQIDSKEINEELVEVTDHVASKSQEELQDIEGKGLEALHIKDRNKHPDEVLVEEKEIINEVVEPLVENAVIEGGERVEKVAAEVVAEVAKDVVRDTAEILKVTEIVDDVSKKVESVVDVVEDVASAAAKGADDIPGIPEYVKERAEETKEFTGEVKEVVGTVDDVALKISDIIEEIKEGAENIENKATELIDNKEKREELIEKAIDYVTGKSYEESTEIQEDVNTDQVVHREEEVGELEENIVKDASNVTDVESMQKEKIGLVDKILQLFSSDESQDHVKEVEKTVVTEVAVIVGEKVEEKITEAVREVTEVVEKEMIDIIKDAQVVEKVSQKVESALEVVEDVAGAAARAAHETPELPESVAEKAELTKYIAEKVENVINTVEHVAEKIKETAEEVQEESENIGKKASELVESQDKREELTDTTIEYVTGKAHEESTEVPNADAAKQTKENKLDLNTNETVNRELGKQTEEIEPTEVSDVTNVNESIQKEETGLVNKILQFFTNDENPEPVNEHGKPLSEEVVLEVGEKIEEKIAEGVSEVADTAEKEMVEVIKEAQVVDDVSQRVESTLEVVEDVADAAAKAAHETPEVPEFVAEVAEMTKEIAEKVEEVTDAVEYIAEKIEDTAEEIKKEVENIGNIASELIESKEKREELLETAIEFVSGKAKEESAEMVSADSGKQTREDEQNINTNEAVDREEMEKPKEASDITNVIESIQKEETGLVNKILQFFTNDENQEPVKEHGKPLSEEVVLEGGEKIEEKIAEAVGDIADTSEKEIVEVIKEAQVVEDVSHKIESTLEVVEDVADAAAKAAHETPEVPEFVAEVAEMTKEIAEKVEEVTGAVEYIAEKIEDTAEEIKKEVENIGNIASELIESKEKREELLETAIEFVSGKAKEESAEMVIADSGKQTREDEQNINTNEAVDREELVKPTEASDISNVIESIQKEETGLVNKILQFFTNDENQEPVKEHGKPLSEEVVLEGGEKIEEKIAEAVGDIADTSEKEIVEVIKEAQVVEDVSQKVESTLEVVEDVADAAAKVTRETPEVPESVAEVAELTKEIAENVEEVIGTVDYIAEKFEETAEGIKKEAENVESTEPTLISDADVSKVEQTEEKVADKFEVVPRKEKLFEKISNIFSKNNTKNEQPTGVISDISTETDVADSSTETVPEPVAGDGSSTEAATSMTGVAVTEDSKVQSPSDVMGTFEGVGDSVSGFSTPEIIDAPSVTSAISEEDQDLVMEVKDKSLFERLSDLVTSDVKQNISSTSQKTDGSVHQLQENIKSEDSNSVDPNKEMKPSLLGKITTIFTDKGSSKVNKQIPVESSEMVKDDMKTDVFIITAKPSRPVDVVSEESAQQSKTSINNLQQGWFRTGADVKQEGKDVIVQLTPDSPAEKDYGQSNPEDADMYTTRS